MNKVNGYRINSSSSFEGFSFSNNLSECLRVIASKERLHKSVIVREALIEKIKAKWPKEAEEFKL